MKRELLKHLAAAVFLTAIVVLVKNYLSLSYWPFVAGMLVGTLAPDVDHLLYVYFLHPHELTSQRVKYMIGKRDFFGVWGLLAMTRDERKDLIFHTFFFQVLFAVLTLWMVSSSESLFGRGMVVGFSLHLVIDQVMDFRAMGNINNWFQSFDLGLGVSRQRWLIGIFFLLTLVFALVF